MKTVVKILLLHVMLVLSPYLLWAQSPANDLCANAHDISDGLWHPGSNSQATKSCTDTYVGYTKPPQQATDMSCGISGIEGTVWFKFTSPGTGPANLEFRNSSCNPGNFFGIVTTLQGFLLKKLGCATPSLDIVVTCFDPPTAADFSRPFTAEPGQEYYVQVDTKKNSFGSCDCNEASSATCHSSCAFEVRVALPIVSPILSFDAKEKSNFVSLKWIYNWKDDFSKFHLIRKNISNGDSVVIASKPVQEFLKDDVYFSYEDFGIVDNGYYKYYLYASMGEDDYELVGAETVSVGFAKEMKLELVPNPANDFVRLMLSNSAGAGYSYIISNALGQIIKTGKIPAVVNAEAHIDVSSVPPGFYQVSVVLEEEKLIQSFVVE